MAHFVANRCHIPIPLPFLSQVRFRCARSTLTFRFAGDSTNIQHARTASGYATLDDWFDGSDTEISEEVIGLGEYGRTLTVLRAESLPDQEEIMTRSDGR